MATYWITSVKYRFARLILEGRKSLDIRYEKHVNVDLVAPGDVILLYAGGAVKAVVGAVKVVKVCKKKLRDLTIEDARAAGFFTRRQLISTLKKMYPMAKPNDHVYLIYVEPYLNFLQSPIPLDFITCIKLPKPRPCCLEDVKGRMTPVDPSSLPMT